jgi:hypothetical protein
MSRLLTTGSREPGKSIPAAISALAVEHADALVPPRICGARSDTRNAWLILPSCSSFVRIYFSNRKCSALGAFGPSRASGDRVLYVCSSLWLPICCDCSAL